MLTLVMSSLKAFKLQFQPNAYLKSRQSSAREMQIRHFLEVILESKSLCWLLLMSSFESLAVSRHFGAAIFICSMILQSFCQCEMAFS